MGVISKACLVYGAIGAFISGVQWKALRCFGRIDSMNLSTTCLLRAGERLLCVVLAGGLPAFAQSASAPANQAELDAKVRMLSQTLEETRVELSESRSEIRQLRAMLELVLRKMGEPDKPAPA